MVFFGKEDIVVVISSFCFFIDDDVDFTLGNSTLQLSLFRSSAYYKDSNSPCLGINFFPYANAAFRIPQSNSGLTLVGSGHAFVKIVIEAKKK